jgi:hypothetical protein
MHSEFGRAGSYANCFVDQVLNQGLFEKILEENEVKGFTPPLENESSFKDVSFTYPGESEKIYEFHSSGDLKAISRFGINDYGIMLLTCVILERSLLKAFPDYTNNFLGISDFQMKLSGTPGKEHKRCARRSFAKAASAYYQNAHSFIESPKALIGEAIITMTQISSWACMHAKNPEEVIRQLDGLLELTIKDPRVNRMISPLEMLGFGNNGMIGNFINYQFPTHIEGELIIKNSWEEGGSIFSDKFIGFWFDQSLQIGGCPALTGKKRSGNAFNNIAKMYIECVQRLKEHQDSLGPRPENKSLQARITAINNPNLE